MKMCSSSVVAFRIHLPIAMKYIQYRYIMLRRLIDFIDCTWKNKLLTMDVWRVYTVKIQHYKLSTIVPIQTPTPSKSRTVFHKSIRYLSNRTH